MPDEEINIRVNQTTSGNALSQNAQKIDELKGKIAELNRLEKVYTEKGLPTAAASTRTERIRYARELRDLQREERSHQKTADSEAAKAARERASQERAANLEARAQRREHEAIVKAKDSAARRVGRAAAGMAESELGWGAFPASPTR